MREDDQPYRRHLFAMRLWGQELGSTQPEWLGQSQYAKKATNALWEIRQRWWRSS
jgi:hypothetical protein